MTEEIIKILMIKTDKCCFISDCQATSGYDFDYHHSKIEELYFDGKLPQKTYHKNWLSISQYPTCIEQKITNNITNERYEINDEDLISKKLPEIILYDNRDDYDYEIREKFYTHKYDELPDMFEFISTEFDIILEVDNFKEAPLINFGAIHRHNFSESPYTIKNIDVKHQILDKIIFPACLLHSRPCSLSSKQVYDITRQYVLENINTSKAKITSNYDFCFEVNKIIPLIEPETISYYNFSARTKKAREKIHFKRKECKEVKIFQMTHDQDNYRGYTAISAIFGDSEEDLKDKVEDWLQALINIINSPLELCPHCAGTGYLSEVEQIDKNKIISDMTNAEKQGEK